MLIFSKLWSVFSVVGRLLTGSEKSAPNDVAASVAGEVAAATAVAGFVYRVDVERVPAEPDHVDPAHVERFFLAARLQSVAKLNTPVGRTPRTSVLPPPYKAAVPAERIGAKMVRGSSGRELRVLTQIQARNAQSAEIIPFPTALYGSLALSAQVAQAA